MLLLAERKCSEIETRYRLFQRWTVPPSSPFSKQGKQLGELWLIHFKIPEFSFRASRKSKHLDCPLMAGCNTGH